MPATVALAWLVQQPTITSAIASATNEGQLESLANAGRLKLGTAAIDELKTVGARRVNAA
jgi:aryl-alcohol dehydrogenase-like predicted oxidoreductase